LSVNAKNSSSKIVIQNLIERTDRFERFQYNLI
jgi:hypothetical protein